MTAAISGPYELYYWGPLPGRGEVIRLICEVADVPYLDRGREPEEDGGGIAAIVAARRGALGDLRPFAPPIVVTPEGTVIAQSGVVARLLAERHGLAPEEELTRAQAQQLFLTWADLLNEVHDTHHPIAVALRYEDQVEAAKERSKHFLDGRLTGWLDYFEDILRGREAERAGPHFVGERMSYVDLQAFFVLRGLRHAFPRAMAVEDSEHPLLAAIDARVASLPRVAAYLASERAIAFNEHGIFRRYPELDVPPTPKDT